MMINEMETGCSSLVPIVETERRYALCRPRQFRKVAVHSFRLWKLKAKHSRRTPNTEFRVAVHSFRLWKLKEAYKVYQVLLVESCSSLVPIVETERQVDGDGEGCKAFVAVHSFRLWKLKGRPVSNRRACLPKLQFTRSDCGN